MKLIAGHKYLRGPNGDIVPYSELLEKASRQSKYKEFIQDKDMVNELQLPENENRAARSKPGALVPTNQVQPERAKLKPVGKPSVFEEMDITKEMEADLKALEE